MIDGQWIANLSRGSQRLLGYLAVTPQAQRNEVAAALWPEGSETNAARALRVALTRLRREIGKGWVNVDGQVLDLEPDIWCDYREVAQTVHALGGRHPVDLQAARSALNLYVADAFRGCYDAWAVEMRQQLHDLAVLGYERVVGLAIQVGDWDVVLDCSLSGIALDPLFESFHRGVMLAHGHRGNPAASIRQYKRLKRLLADELGISPSQPTRQALDASLRFAGVSQ